MRPTIGRTTTATIAFSIRSPILIARSASCSRRSTGRTPASSLPPIMAAVPRSLTGATMARKSREPSKFGWSSPVPTRPHSGKPRTCRRSFSVISRRRSSTYSLSTRRKCRAFWGRQCVLRQIEKQQLRRLRRGDRQLLLVGHGGAVARSEFGAVCLHTAACHLDPGGASGIERVRDSLFRGKLAAKELYVLMQRQRSLATVG